MKITYEIERKWNWIAKDENGRLYVYSNPPKIDRKNARWCVVNGEYMYLVSIYLGSEEYGINDISCLSWDESLHKIDHDNNRFIKEKMLPNLKVDTKVLVRNCQTDPWKKRYFKKFCENGCITTFQDGATSWSDNKDYGSIWNEWKLPE